MRVENPKSYLHADGRVDDYLALADKAMREGKFEKAHVYVLLAQAWQVEREKAGP